jgi:hypothetical protein
MWELDTTRTLQKGNLTWLPQWTITPMCSTPHVIFLELFNGAFGGMTEDDVRQEILSILKTPWESMAFQWPDDGPDETDFQDWFNEALAQDPDLYTNLIKNKPSWFTTQYPKWSFKGKEYSTDFYATTFKDSPYNIDDSAKSSITIVITPLFHVQTETKSYVVPAGQGAHFFTQIAAQTGDPYSTAWDSRIWVQVNAHEEYERFVSQLNSVAHFFHQLGHGVRIPFDLSLLPHEKLTGVNLLLNIYYNVAGIMNDPVYQYRIPVQMDNQFGSELTTNQWNWVALKKFLHLPTYSNCLKEQNAVHNSVDIRLQFIQKIVTYLNQIRTVNKRLIEYMVDKDTLYKHESLIDELDQLVNKSLEIQGLLLHSHNVYLHVSEGFLQFKEYVTAVSTAYGTCINRNLLNSEQSAYASQMLQNVTVDQEEAIRYGIYKPEYETAKRPLYNNQIPVLEEEQIRRPYHQTTQGIVKIILSTILLLGLLAIVVLFINLIWRRYRRRAVSS